MSSWIYSSGPNLYHSTYFKYNINTFFFFQIPFTYLRIFGTKSHDLSGSYIIISSKSYQNVIVTRPLVGTKVMSDNALGVDGCSQERTTSFGRRIKLSFFPFLFSLNWLERVGTIRVGNLTTKGVIVIPCFLLLLSLFFYLRIVVCSELFRPLKVHSIVWSH